MRIVIDLRIYGPKTGGLGRYNEEFLRELIKLQSPNKFVLLFRDIPSNLKLPDNFSVRLCNYHWYSLKEQLLLPLLLYRLGADYVHFTHFNVPILYRRKYLLTIHDLIMTRYPSRRASTLNRFLFKFKYRVYQLVISNAVAKSSKLIAVSQYVADDISSYFSLGKKHRKKIQVIYEGVSFNGEKPSGNISLPEKYFLYVGNAYPHKNLERLIRVFAKFRKVYYDYYLVLVGNSNYFYKRLQTGAKTETNIIFSGFVSDNDLPAYYKGATVYIFPSLHEGFGLPPLEAMKYDIPVVSSNAASLPEVLGDAALYFDPKSEHDMLEKMNEVISNNSLRAELVSNGRKRTKLYSWRRMAEKINNLYSSL